ncbi:MAG: diphthine synthase, partial [Candidatus Altiarchaeota archaeon]|nr:diphthine synthase [Candidatus Altiarchaeota archaeon]
EMEKQKGNGVIKDDTLCVGVAKLGGDVDIKAGKIKDVMKHDFGKPPHVIVIPGKLHYMEEEALKQYGI